MCPPAEPRLGVMVNGNTPPFAWGMTPISPLGAVKGGCERSQALPIAVLWGERVGPRSDVVDLLRSEQVRLLRHHDALDVRQKRGKTKVQESARAPLPKTKGKSLKMHRSNHVSGIGARSASTDDGQLTQDAPCRSQLCSEKSTKKSPSSNSAPAQPSSSNSPPSKHSGRLAALFAIYQGPGLFTHHTVAHGPRILSSASTSPSASTHQLTIPRVASEPLSARAHLVRDSSGKPADISALRATKGRGPTSHRHGSVPQRSQDLPSKAEEESTGAKGGALERVASMAVLDLQLRAVEDDPDDGFEEMVLGVKASKIRDHRGSKWREG